jgi:hypothetical protein
MIGAYSNLSEAGTMRAAFGEEARHRSEALRRPASRLPFIRLSRASTHHLTFRPNTHPRDADRAAGVSSPGQYLRRLSLDS